METWPTLRLALDTALRCWPLNYLLTYVPPTYLQQARALWHALAERAYLPPPLHTYELSTEASQSGGGKIRLRATETVTT